MTEDAWAPLSFQRDSYEVMIRKPILDSTPYIRITALQGQSTDLRTRPDLARSSGVTVIAMEFVTGSSIPWNQIGKKLNPVALDVLRDIRGWIRFLARQYWIGHREDFADVQHYTVNLIDGIKREPLTTAGTGPGYNYYRLLDGQIWEDIGTKLRRNEKPRPGQLYLCDGLLEIAQLNLAATVIAFGMACELEVFALIEDILDVKGDQCRTSAEEIEWRRFTEKLDELERLCGGKFYDLDPEANRLVKELYKLRGKAAHRARLPFEDPQESGPANAAKLLPYVKAVEKLFTWLEVQRSKVLQSPL